MTALEAAVHAFFCVMGRTGALIEGVYPKNEPLETKSETLHAGKVRSTIET